METQLTNTIITSVIEVFNKSNFDYSFIENIENDIYDACIYLDRSVKQNSAVIKTILENNWKEILIKKEKEIKKADKDINKIAKICADYISNKVAQELLKDKDFILDEKGEFHIY